MDSQSQTKAGSRLHTQPQSNSQKSQPISFSGSQLATGQAPEFALDKMLQDQDLEQPLDLGLADDTDTAFDSDKVTIFWLDGSVLEITVEDLVRASLALQLKYSTETVVKKVDCEAAAEAASCAATGGRVPISTRDSASSANSRASSKERWRARSSASASA